MNFHSIPSVSLHNVAPKPEWQRRVEAWRDLVAQCARKPSRKRVHALRSLTLRLRALLEYSLQGQAPATTAMSAFRRWNKEGRKLRRVLQPVRDADVYLVKLDSLRNTQGRAPYGESQLSPSCLGEIDVLECRLKRQRRVGADELMAVIDARRQLLNRLSKEMEVAIGPTMPSSAGPTGQGALQIFAGLASEHPDLDSANLHAYRKRLKQALYLAEISSAADPESERLAGAFRKIHDATGEWHDWQALALEAARVLPSHSNHDSLIPVLETLAEGALKSALKLCQRTEAQFLQGVGKARPTQRRKPVASDRGYQPCEDYLSLGISS
jgi:CHAD domain-containing protein